MTSMTTDVSELEWSATRAVNPARDIQARRQARLPQHELSERSERNEWSATRAVNPARGIQTRRQARLPRQGGRAKRDRVGAPHLVVFEHFGDQRTRGASSSSVGLKTRSNGGLKQRNRQRCLVQDGLEPLSVLAAL